MPLLLNTANIIEGIFFQPCEQPYDIVRKKAQRGECYHDHYRGFSVILFLANVIIAFGFRYNLTQS